MNNDILATNQDIATKEGQINGNVIDFDDLYKALNEFFMGWMSYLSGASSGSNTKTLAKQIFDNKITEVKYSLTPQKKDLLIDQLTLKSE